MTKNQSAELISQESVIGFFNQHPEFEQASPMLAQCVNRLRNYVAVVNDTKGVQLNALIGVTANKSAMREMINQEVKNLCLLMVPYHSIRQNPLAKERAQAAGDGFYRLREAEVFEVVKMICTDALAETEENLLAANIQKLDVSNLLSLGTTYQSLVTGTKANRESRTHATAIIAATLPKGRYEVNVNISGLMRAFRKSHPDLVDYFDRLTVVDYPHRRHRKEEEVPATALVTFTFTDEASNQPIEGALLAIDGKLHEEPSDDNGEIYIDTLTPGTHNVVVSAPGYQSLEWTTQALVAGQEYEIEEFLTPEPGA